MKTFTLTEAQQNFDDMLNLSLVEAVKIQKYNKDFAVIISAEKYAELERLNELVEDNILGAMSEKALKEGFTADSEVTSLLDNIRNA
ncbi:MAG: PHD/YefM family antitoxin component YafN of YafNO toxin-antitoxin module [Phenylobacterium sp.]|jgi:PHD/YefM family antitoxin component YafN of YafNO toxin-antitoxin module